MVPHVEAAKGRGTKQHRGIAPPLHCRVFYFFVEQGAVAAGAVAVRIFVLIFGLAGSWRSLVASLNGAASNAGQLEDVGGMV